jgi:hypothetical protein
MLTTQKSAVADFFNKICQELRFAHRVRLCAFAICGRWGGFMNLIRMANRVREVHTRYSVTTWQPWRYKN